MRIAVPAVLVMTIVVAVGTDLGAHVTVQPREVVAKSSQEFFVRVPNEKEQPTTSVRIVFPEGFEVLRVRPASGWKHEFERDAAGKVTGITWSGGLVGRAEYEVFSFIARAQAPGIVKLDAYQTYGTNDIVAWVNPAEPRPAPQVNVVAAASTPAVANPPAAEPAPADNRTTFLVGAASLMMSLTALVMSWRGSNRSRT